MSFILDALKKSDQARQVADIPELDYWVQATDPVKSINWVMILLVFILLFNLVAVGGWWLANAQSLGSLWASKPTAPVNSTPLPVNLTFDLPAAVPVTETPQPKSSPKSFEKTAPAMPAKWVVGTDTQVVNDVKDLGSQFDELGFEIIRPGASLNQAHFSSQASQQGDSLNILPLAELPESIRSQMPELNIISHIFTQAPHRRTVILNQRRYRQGDEVSAGLVLETIEPNHLVFSYLGTYFRYEVKL